MDLGIVEITFKWSPSLRWWWTSRYHFKRFFKRHIPRLKRTCDWCGEVVRRAASIRQDENGEYLGGAEYWVVGCMNCAEKLGWGHWTMREAADEALSEWIRTGGDVYVLRSEERRQKYPWLRFLGAC